MKNRGFTLVELLTVIILLGILSVVIIPKIGDVLTSSRSKTYQVQVESIKKGAYDFLVDNCDFMEDNDSISFTLGILKRGGYLPIDIKNPLTRKSFSNDSVISVTLENGVYNFEIDLVDVQNYNEEVNSNSPILVLNGNYIEYVDVNGEYDELGAVAFDYTGASIVFDDTPQYFLDDLEVADIDTSSLGTYSALYSVTDSYGNSSVATRTIIVRDKEAPVISVPNDTVLSVSDVQGFDPLTGVSVVDNYDSDLTVMVDNGVAGIVGKYVITYTATDSSGNSSSVRRVVRVQ